MVRKCAVDRLPPEVREQIGRLRDRGCTIDEILGKLRELDPQTTVSRSALGRYTQRIDAIGEKIRESRGVAEALIAKLGEGREDRQLRLNVELLHAQLLDMLTAEGEDAIILSPRDAHFLARTLKDLAAALRLDQDRELKIREQAATDTARAAAEVATTVARERGLSAEVISEIKQRIAGVRLPVVQAA